MITEPEKVNYYNHTVAGSAYQYNDDDFARAAIMKRSFFKDQLCKMLAGAASFQAVSTRYEWPIEHAGFEFIFSAGVRCKWDLLVRPWKMGGDIKSTVSETEKQFEAACHHFNYFRSRAWYMDIEGTDKDVLIGISKKNYKVFKIGLDRNAPLGTKARDLYELGKSQYQELAFKYWTLFDGIKLVA
ncbi:hypothetical protein [Hufsiella ginkgonis]|nr:hypothetical protein [Hufsiella ginkgonis]